MPITYQQEFLLSAQNEIVPLLEDHWKEVSSYPQEIVLNPNWEVYHFLEKMGILSIFTARDNGKLVGYLSTMSQSSLHHKDSVFAVTDAIFIKEDYRKGFTGIRLIRFAEFALKQDGVSVFTINTTVYKPFDKLLLWMGFKHIESTYSKFLRY